MNTKVTVIVPVYNTADFIEKCAHSLFNQTLSEIEFIFIDDATPDDSISRLEKVIEGYPERKNNIRIIHNSENLGPAICRDKALDLAAGNYILVVDSDDYIDENMVELMFEEATKSNADIVVSDMSIEFETKKINFRDYVPDNRQNYFPEMLTNEKSSPSLCNKLIKKELYLNPNCRNSEKARYMEDRLVCSRIYFYASEIVKINKPLYHYLKHNTLSITSSYNTEHFNSLLNFWKSMDVFLFKNNVSEQYRELVIHTKLKDKLKLMMYVDSCVTRKKYATAFSETDNASRSYLRPGEKIMDFLLRNKLFIFTSALQKLIKLKSHIS